MILTHHNALTKRPTRERFSLTIHRCITLSDVTGISLFDQLLMHVLCEASMRYASTDVISYLSLLTVSTGAIRSEPHRSTSNTSEMTSSVCHFDGYSRLSHQTQRSRIFDVTFRVGEIVLLLRIRVCVLTRPILTVLSTTRIPASNAASTMRHRTTDSLTKEWHE